MTNLSKGLLAAITSNALFAMLFLYGVWMQPMSGTEIFAWRMVAMLSALCVLMTMVNGWQVVAVCLGGGQRRRRKHRHGLFPVSFGDDAGWTDLV